MTDELKIESKTKVAADAAISINRYLEELNGKLVDIGVENAYTIISDTEEIIIDLLNAVGSPTKLGTEMVIKLIQDEIGTPDEFIEQYIQDLNNAGDIQISSLNLDGKQLVRRKRRVAKIKSKKEPRKIRSASEQHLPIIFMTFTIVLFFGSFFGPVDGMIIAGMFSALLGWLIQLILEINQGRSGRLELTVRSTIENRYIFRGLIFLNLGFLYGISMNSYNYSNYARNISGNAALILLLGLIILETVIFLRDHTHGYFPLEKSYRPAIRMITPPYLLLLASIFFLLAPGYWEKYYYSQTLAFAAGTWAFAKKAPVTYRFYFTAVAVQFASTVIIDDLFVLFMIYPIVLITVGLFRSSRKIEETSKKKGPIRRVISSINLRLDEYYKGDVGNE